MSKVFAVAWREFKHTALTRAFLIAAVFGPLVMFAMAIILPIVMSTPPKKLEGRIAVIDSTGTIVAAVRAELDQDVLRAEHEEKLARIQDALEKVPESFRGPLEGQLENLLEFIVPEISVVHESSSNALDELKQQAREGELLAIAVYQPAALDPSPESNQFELFTAANLSRRHTDLLRDLLAQAVVRSRTEIAGLDLQATQALLRRPTAITSTLTEEGEARENEALQLFLPFIFMMLLWMSTWVSGQYLLTSTIEEKANKVVEVLLSAVSPMQLMTGKILGQACVGLVMIGIYTLLGTIVAGRFDYGHLVPTESLVYLALYFFMAYFMIAALMASVGSAVNELREAQSLMGPIAMVFMIPLFVWFVIADDPNSTFATVLSFIPPITPFVMILRVTSVEVVPLWQIILTTILGYATVFALIWMCAKIFRVGLLMYGKPPTPRELIKWMRYS